MWSSILKSIILLLCTPKRLKEQRGLWVPYQLFLEFVINKDSYRQPKEFPFGADHAAMIPLAFLVFALSSQFLCQRCGTDPAGNRMTIPACQQCTLTQHGHLPVRGAQSDSRRVNGSVWIVHSMWR